MRNFAFTGRQLPLPPKSTFQCNFPSDANSIVRSEGYPKPTGGPCHQRKSSDSLLLDEQTSWLEELLNEPETPTGRGHQRSSSDSIAYLNGPAKAIREEGYKYKNTHAGPSMGFSNFDHHKGLSHASFHSNTGTSHTHQNKALESSSTSVTSSSGSLSTSDGISLQNSGSSCNPQELDGMPSKANVKKGGEDPECSSVTSDCCNSNPSTSRADSERTKQYVVHSFISSGIVFILCYFLIQYALTCFLQCS